MADDEANKQRRERGQLCSAQRNTCQCEITNCVECMDLVVWSLLFSNFAFVVSFYAYLIFLKKSEIPKLRFDARIVALQNSLQHSVDVL